MPIDVKILLAFLAGCQHQVAMFMEALETYSGTGADATPPTETAAPPAQNQPASAATVRLKPGGRNLIARPILDVLREVGRPLLQVQIREELLSRGYDRSLWQVGDALKRLLDAGYVTRLDNHFSLRTGVPFPESLGVDDDV